MSGARLTDKLNDYPLQYVDLSGQRQGYRCAGRSGPVIVFLHGISSGSGSWVSQLEALSARGFRVIAWDAPGYGQSTPLATHKPSAEDYAARLLQLFDALGIDRATLVGHSLGALQASAFAANHPERLSGLVLASPAQGYGQADAELQAEVYTKRPDMLRRLGPVEMARERAPALLAPNADSDRVNLVADGMHWLHLEGFSAASWLLAYDDIWRYLPDWCDNLLVICGNEDQITPPEGARSLAKRARQASYVELQPAGHAVYIDVPDQFNDALVIYVELGKTGNTLIP